MRRNRSQHGRIAPDTSHRRLLLTIMQEAEKHLDAKELYRRASDKDASISLATVYRTLQLFKEQGVINEMHLGQARCYYEMKRSGEHQHLVCESCGQVIDFESHLVGKLVAEVQRKNDFCATNVELYLLGYCSKCKEGKSKPERPK